MQLDDPTDFEGGTPTGEPNEPVAKKPPRSNAATGASAAGMRAFTAQAVAFYFRVPVKAFFRTRVDYLASARAINPHVKTGGFSWHTTTPGLLVHAVKKYGWRFIPEHVLPPLAANVTVGAVLYTSYLQLLGALYEPSSHATKVVFPPPPPAATFTAGFVAGGFQSLIAAPLDALQVRFDLREGHYENKSMWAYGREKLREIGIRGVFAGWSLSFLKDSFGSGLFFATFEFVKGQSYYHFVRTYYGSLEPWMVQRLAYKYDRTLLPNPSTSITSQSTKSGKRNVPVIRPHYALEPAFLTLAGVLASCAQQGVLYPLNKVQNLHYERLESLDQQAVKYSLQSPQQGRGRMMRAYYHAYQETWRQCKEHAASSSIGVRGGSVGRWLYQGFLGNTIKQLPSTSAGLVIFELVRRKYGMGGTEIKIRLDGYDILLS